jgi:hypothetical protein
MDLNYLYRRHQVSLFNAENAACEQSRLAHLGLVAAYSEKIEQARRGSGARRKQFDTDARRIDPPSERR